VKVEIEGKPRGCFDFHKILVRPPHNGALPSHTCNVVFRIDKQCNGLHCLLHVMPEQDLELVDRHIIPFRLCF